MLITYALFLTLPQLIHVGPDSGVYNFYGYDTNGTLVLQESYSIESGGPSIINWMCYFENTIPDLTCTRAFVDYGISNPMRLDRIVSQQMGLVYGIMIAKLFLLFFITFYSYSFSQYSKSNCKKTIKLLTSLIAFFLFCAFAANMLSLNKSLANMVDGQVDDTKGSIYIDTSESGDLLTITPFYIGRFNNYDELFADITKYNNPTRCYDFDVCQETSKLDRFQILHIFWICASACALLVLMIVLIVDSCAEEDGLDGNENIFAFSDSPDR